MDSQESMVVQNLVEKIKQEIFSSQVDLYSLVSPSPYDTAWLSMIPNPQQSDKPLFQGCLDWVLENQNRGGSWGESGTGPSIDCLTSTLACIVALTTWNVGHVAIQKGLAFIHANTEKLLEEQNGYFPEWFVIVFPAMVELAETKGLHVYFSNGSTALVEHVFLERRQIFQMQTWDQQQCPPALMQYLEALPETYPNEILLYQSDEDGLIRSPSAIAYAFMKTGNKEFLSNLNSIVQRCGSGVPPIHPLDEDLLKMLVVNQIETLGLAEHFMEDMKNLLGQVYRSYISCEEPKSMAKHVMPLQLYRDSLAFRLLRLHGYAVSPRKFCRFLKDEDIVVYIEEHHEIFLSAMYNVYRATDLTFTGESQLEDVRAFSRRILERETKKNVMDLAGPISVQEQIKHEISIPWLARLDHLEHRRCIESKGTIGAWTGKSLSYRLSCQTNAMLLQLAIENYTLRQFIFRNELKELVRWSKDMGLCDMGFAREKTTYCYFAVASTTSHSSLSDVRMAVVKSAVITTVADDFFDRQGSMEELEALANAVKRWQQKGLNGHGKTIFNALKDLVNDMCGQFFNKNGYDIKRYLQHLWYQAFESWLKEAHWSRNGHDPSIVEYIQVATISIASQTILLTAAILLTPPADIDILKSHHSQPLTNSLMLLTRLLNEIRSYQKEQEEGTPNLVLLHMKENPNLGLEESVGIIKKMMDEKKKEFLEQALSSDEMPEACKQLHLSCLKVFQMFFNSTNAFDSPTELLADINKAIYDPLRVEDVQGYIMPLNSLPSNIGLKQDKSLASFGKSHHSSSKHCNGNFESTCAIKIQGNSRKEFVGKPYSGVLPLKMRKPTIYMTFPKPKTYVFQSFY